MNCNARQAQNANGGSIFVDGTAMLLRVNVTNSLTAWSYKVC